MSFTLTDEEKQILLKTARTVITNALRNEDVPLPEPTENLSEKCGAFVTLRKEGRLRGCIGQMTGTKPLYDTIQEVAVSSAFHDPRFPGLSPEELNEVTIEITVLTPLEEIDDPSRIEVGTHGIYMQRGSRSGVLLPQVATEQGWDRETFLEHTCKKAGLSGECWKDTNTRISIFKGIIFNEA